MNTAMKRDRGITLADPSSIQPALPILEQSWQFALKTEQSRHLPEKTRWSQHWSTLTSGGSTRHLRRTREETMTVTKKPSFSQIFSLENSAP